MKMVSAILLSLALLLSLVACDSHTFTDITQTNNVKQIDQTINSDTDAENVSVLVDESADSLFGIDSDRITSLDDELEVRVEEYLANAITSLSLCWETLSMEIDTYKKYCDNAEKISDFYQTVVLGTEQMCIMLYDYSATFVRAILDSDMSADDKYDAVDVINDYIYEDACDEIHDEIYEGILDDMYDYLYEGILNNAKDNVNYSDWYDVCSDEYDQWYDTSSEVYDLYYKAASDIYSFYYDMSSELYSRDYERAEKVYERFLRKIAKLKGMNKEASNEDAVFDTTLRIANSAEELETVVERHVSECVQALYIEWENLSADIDSFDKYMDNVDVIEAFHARIENAASQILVMICNYGVVYTDLILQSGSSTKDMYKDFENFNDCIYEDSCNIVKEGIYEDLLSEVKEYYYEGIINDAKDSVKYSDWSDARGDTYGWWSDACGEVYKKWSDTRSDLYSFYSDIRSELYGGDIDEVNGELQDFRDKYSGGATNFNTPFTDSGNETEKKENSEESKTDGIHPEFKKAMDAYELFFDEYAKFMKEYQESEDVVALMSKYNTMMSQYVETMTALIGAILMVACVFLPYSRATEKQMDFIDKYSDEVVYEEINLTAGDMKNVSLIKYACIYNTISEEYVGDSSIGIFYIVLVALVGGGALVAALFVLGKKPIGSILFGALSCGVFRLVNFSFSERDVIPSDSYNWSIAYMLFPIAAAILLLGAGWMFVKKIIVKKKLKRMAS